MTGPAEGKLLLEGTKVLAGGKEIPAEVYIHLKGYSFARVTHLDIEDEELSKLHPRGDFLSIYGIKGGIEIKLDKKRSVKVLHHLLNEVLPEGNKTRTWVGSKAGGIYIGFRRQQIQELERVARVLRRGGGY